MKEPVWVRDKLHALAIEADEMLGSCDASDILDTLEEARNAMTEGAEVIANLMVELQYSKDGLAVLLDEARKRERDALKDDLHLAASPEHGFCDICIEGDVVDCAARTTLENCFRWRGVQEDD